jgi:ribose 5-phosphate isomerase A
MTRDEQKRAAAEAALKYVRPDTVIGVGTGSTAGFFIAALAARLGLVAAAVASSEASAAALHAAGIPVVGLDEAPLLPLYVDGADVVDPQLRLIKGAGGALAREKVVASAAALFVCIVDEAKLVERLGDPPRGSSSSGTSGQSGGGRAAGTNSSAEGSPVPLAVLPMAVTLVTRRVRDLGSSTVARRDYSTDDGGVLLDVTGLDLSDPERVEVELDAIPGVVECGIFARRPADVVIVGTGEGVRILSRA